MKFFAKWRFMLIFNKSGRGLAPVVLVVEVCFLSIVVHTIQFRKRYSIPVVVLL